MGRLTIHCSLNLLEKTCLFVKFMLMILSLCNILVIRIWTLDISVLYVY
jgi:hypothetical protein